MNAAGAWDELIVALRTARQVLIIGHVNPDADALGSALALQASINAAGIPAQVAIGTPGFTVPRALEWLPGALEVTGPEAVTGVEDVVVAVDCAAADRLGVLLPYAQNAEVFAVIDHHQSNLGFAGINLIDAQAPATGVLVAELINRAGWPWAPGVAENIYAAIASDTGSFRFPATTAKTHRLAAELHERGIDHAAIARSLFAARPLSVARLSAEVLGDARYDATGAGGAGVIIGTVPESLRERLGVPYEDVESVIADLASIGDADVAVIVKQDRKSVV